MRFRKSAILAGFQPLRGKIIAGSKIRLREKKTSDVRNDYRWQSDADLATLDAAPTLVMSFHVYLLDYSEEMLKHKNHRFPLAIETLDGKHIGNCTYYDIDEKKSEAQLGIMIGDRDYWNQGYGTDVIQTMLAHVFMTTTINRVYLKTLDWNMRAQKCFNKCGFSPYGSLKRNGYDFVLMEITREQWEQGQNKRSSGGQTN